MINSFKWLSTRLRCRGALPDDWEGTDVKLSPRSQVQPAAVGETCSLPLGSVPPGRGLSELQKTHDHPHQWESPEGGLLDTADFILIWYHYKCYLTASGTDQAALWTEMLSPTYSLQGGFYLPPPQNRWSVQFLWKSWWEVSNEDPVSKKDQVRLDSRPSTGRGEVWENTDSCAMK